MSDNVEAGGSGSGAVATLTCPHCGARESLAMPTDACLFFFECPACKVMMRPKQGYCCVFCSYGDRPCPSMA